jgi:hypothetical protein
LHKKGSPFLASLTKTWEEKSSKRFQLADERLSVTIPMVLQGKGLKLCFSSKEVTASIATCNILTDKIKERNFRALTS